MPRTLPTASEPSGRLRHFRRARDAFWEEENANPTHVLTSHPPAPSRPLPRWTAPPRAPHHAAGAPHLSSPVGLAGDSPGDQANFDDTSPAPADPASPKSPGWREMAEERPSTSPGGGPPTVTPPMAPASPAAAPPGDLVVNSPGPASPGAQMPMSPASAAPMSPGFDRRPAPKQGLFGKMGAQVGALAEKAKKRSAKNARRAEGGKLLLQQLQDEAKAKDPSVLPGVLRKPALDPRYVPPNVGTALNAKIFGTPPPPDPATGLVPVGTDADALAVKSSTFYKFKASKRRGKQSAYVAAGKARKRPDEAFDALWARVQRQEALLNKIKQDGKRYARAMAEAADAAHAMAGHIAELADGDAAGAALPAADDAGSAAAAAAAAAQSREQVAARARQLVAMMDTLEVDVRPACAEQLRSALMQPVAQLCEEFPAYKPCVDKRRNYMLDMDAYERKLEHTKAHTKDPGQIPHREEQHSRASRRFAQFNDKLVDDLTLLDNNRFELAGFLIENFVETQEFEVNRKRDVYLSMQEGKLPQRAN